MKTGLSLRWRTKGLSKKSGEDFRSLHEVILILTLKHQQGQFSDQQIISCKLKYSNGQTEYSYHNFLHWGGEKINFEALLMEYNGDSN